MKDYAGCLFFAVWVILGLWLGGEVLEYNIETWVTAFGGFVDVPNPHLATNLLGFIFFWPNMIVGLVTLLLSASGIL